MQNRTTQKRKSEMAGDADVTLEEATEEEYGKAWFLWKDWRVDEPFIEGFSSYMTTLVTKWRHQLQPGMDPKIGALLKEREVGGSLVHNCFLCTGLRQVLVYQKQVSFCANGQSVGCLAKVPHDGQH